MPLPLPLQEQDVCGGTALGIRQPQPYVHRQIPRYGPGPVADLTGRSLDRVDDRVKLHAALDQAHIGGHVHSYVCTERHPERAHIGPEDLSLQQEGKNADDALLGVFFGSRNQGSLRQTTTPIRRATPWKLTIQRAISLGS